MILTDTHSHLFLKQFDNDRRETIEKAISENVSRIFLPNVDISTIEPLMSVCKEFPENCFPLMGLHPTSVNENYRQELDVIEKQLAKNKFYGIGEIGIDLYWDKTFLEQQKEVFIKQIEWAKEMELPIIIHCRNSFDEIVEIMDKQIDDKLFGIFHSFTGNIKQAQKIMEWKNFKIGIGGIVTFKNAGLDKTVKEIPLSNILLETDSPYLTPIPFRGKRNESSYLVYIAKKIAEIHNTSLEEVARITTENANNIFMR